jgi:hypothetical protein
MIILIPVLTWAGDQGERLLTLGPILFALNPEISKLHTEST